MAMKTTSPFTNLLRQSPFRMLQEHMRAVSKCFTELTPLIEALIKNDRESMRRIADNIRLLESEADRIKDHFRLHMPKPLFLAVDRRDLLVLIADQDLIADTVEKISQIMVHRKMIIPDVMKPLLLEIVQLTTITCKQAAELIEQLDELLAVGFGGKQSDRVSEMIANVKRSEHQIDDLQTKIIQTLFSMEDDLDPVSVIFLYNLIDLIGQVSNQAENLGDRLMLFIST